MSDEKNAKVNRKTADPGNPSDTGFVSSRTRSSDPNKIPGSTDKSVSGGNGTESSDSKSPSSITAKEDILDDSTTNPPVQSVKPNMSRDKHGIKAPPHQGKNQSEDSETEFDEALDSGDRGETLNGKCTTMNRRPLHHSSDKKSPTLSPKASPGRTRRTKTQESPSVKQSKEKEISEDENDSDQDEELENEAIDENNSAEVKPKNKQDKKLYPDLTRELRNRKKDNSPNKAKEGKKGSTKSEKPLYDDESNGKTKEERSSLLIVLLFAVIAVAIVVLLVFVLPDMFDNDNSKDSKVPKFDGYKLFKEDFNKLKSEFPDQSSRFWKVIGSQIRRILTHDSPTYPATILLGVPQSQQALGSCFTKKIVRMINKAMNTSGDFYIDTQNLGRSSPDQTKLELDQKMHTALQSSKSAILDHIETLPGEAALLLHAYCDGDNAPYKKAVIFLNLHSPKTFPDSETMQDSFVEDILVNLWQADLGQDEMPALQARIANNIAVMKTEKGNVCS